jgi:repressor LexA
MKPLNKSQLKILEFLKKKMAEGVPPTVREICEATGLRSTSTVHSYLQVLEERGYITRQSGANRAIKIAGSNDTLQVPLVGTVTAGMPILAVENAEGFVPYAANNADPKHLFALHVKGDSMINAGILDGDIIIVEQTPVATNGEIIVALIDDEATVKRFYKENGHFRLQPENDDYAPIIVDEVSVLGKVVSLIRNF